MSDLYSVLFTGKARRQVEKVPRDVQERIAARLNEIQAQLFHPPLSRKLKNKSGQRSTRVGDYRVLYSADRELRRVFVEAVGHRREVYD